MIRGYGHVTHRLTIGLGPAISNKWELAYAVLDALFFQHLLTLANPGHLLQQFNMLGAWQWVWSSMMCITHRVGIDH